AVSVKENLYLLCIAIEIFTANLEDGWFLTLSSIAATTPTGGAMTCSVTQAAGLNVMRCLV
ncbi:hypothetical protein HOY82DRAFT_491115, partial [Tuber indicum]